MPGAHREVSIKRIVTGSAVRDPDEVHPVSQDCTLPLPSSAYVRGLPMVAVKTESEDLPGSRSISVDHHNSDDHAQHAHRHSPSAETQKASPNVAPLAVFLPVPYFSGLLFLVVNIIAI